MPSTDAQRAEGLLIAKARGAIERHRKGPLGIRVVKDGKPVAGARIEVEQIAHDFLFGCNIYMFDRFPTSAENRRYRQRFRELFNYATVGFYWRSFEPEQGKPQYEYTDKVVAWCLKNAIKVKGHPLLWDHEAGRPTWSGYQQPPPEIQRRRVHEIITRYRGRIGFWEVVNEPAHCRRVGIDHPYRWAREANPEAHLIVNDFEVMANRYPPFHELLQEAQSRAVPFDGIGIQAHEPRTMRFPLTGVQEALNKYASLGKDLHITEFTPTSAGQPITGSHLEGRWDESTQADYAAKFYTLCFAHPAVVAITWWDLCDRGSWLEGGGMLREDLGPKPVYVTLRKLIHGEWHTRTAGKTDARGRYRFRGFFGRYKARVVGESGTATAEFNLRRRGKRSVVVEMP